MDDKWRTVRCDNCNGNGVFSAFDTVCECGVCDMTGRIWIRPSGHLFRWPGGPALGKTSLEEYEQATPVDD